MTFALDIKGPARGVAGRVVGRSGYRRRSVYARWIRLLRVRVRPDGPYALDSARTHPPQLYTVPPDGSIFKVRTSSDNAR